MGRRKRGGHGGGHGGAWKVAYADFVTSMMALFMILWLTGLVDKSQKGGLAEYFKNPTIFKERQGLMPGQQNPVEIELRPDVDVMRPPPDPQLQPVSQPPAATESIEGELNQAMAEGSLWPFRDRVQVKSTPEGLEVSVVEKSRQVLFDSGSAVPKAETLDILKAIARTLRGHGNHLLIGGHTDAHPLEARGGYSNWELSADRANRARAVLEGEGVDRMRFAMVRGFADTRPANAKDPFASENRRLSIVIMNQ